MELLKDYDCTILYHPSKVNVVANALSQKSMHSMAHIAVARRSIVQELQDLGNMGVKFEVSGSDALSAHFSVRPILIDRIRDAQARDTFVMMILGSVGEQVSEFDFGSNGLLRHGSRIYVPNLDGLKEEILKEAHVAAYAVHPGATKMYHDLRSVYWLQGLNKDVREYVSRCLVCQQVKAEHQRPSELLQPLPIPEWKWDHMAMDFVTALPRVKGGYDSI